jgi:hypothetical protein
MKRRLSRRNFMKANPAVTEDRGRVAVQGGRLCSAWNNRPSR